MSAKWTTTYLENLAEKELDKAMVLAQEGKDVLAPLDISNYFYVFFSNLLSNVEFNCEVCGSQHKYKSELERHQLTHTSDCTWSCPTCHKVFKHKGSLNCHMSQKAH